MMHWKSLPALALLAALGACTHYNHIVIKPDGKLLVATSGTLKGGAVLECTQDGDALDCRELRVVIAGQAPAAAKAGVTQASQVVLVDRNKLDMAQRKLSQWRGRTIVMTISDGTLMSGMLTEVRGTGTETMLVIQSSDGPKAAYLRDIIRVTAASKAQ